MSTAPTDPTPRLTSLSHGGGCDCQLSPGVLADLLRGSAATAPFAALCSARRAPTTPRSIS